YLPSRSPGRNILSKTARPETHTLWRLCNARPELLSEWKMPNRFGTIAIPTRNRPATIRKTLTALIDNLTLWGHTEVEILIIDDSSTEELINGNKQAIKDLSARGVKIRYMGRREFDRFVDYLAERIAEAMRKPYLSIDTTYFRKLINPASPKAKDRIAEALKESVFPSQIGGKRNLLMSVLVGQRFIMADDDALPVARFVPAGAIDDSERMEKDTKEISIEDKELPVEEVPVDIVEGVNRCMGKGEYFCNFKILNDDDWSVKTFVDRFLTETDNKYLFGTLKTGASPFKRLALRPDLDKGQLGEAPVTTTYVGVDNSESVVLPFAAEWLEDELIGIFRQSVFGKGRAAFAGLGSVHERSVESSSRNIPRNLFFETLHKILIDITKEFFSDMVKSYMRDRIVPDILPPDVTRTMIIREIASRSMTFSKIVWAVDSMEESHKKWLPRTVRKFMCEEPVTYQKTALDAADALLDEGRIEDARACYEFAQGLTRFFHLREDEREPEPAGYMDKLAETMLDTEVIPRLATIPESLITGNLAIGALEKETGIVERFTVPAEQLTVEPIIERPRPPAATIERRIAFEQYIRRFNERKGRAELNNNARSQEIAVQAPTDSAS
ncbi:MAG TPA: glycosyltransferase, partial [bacterium]|nr:glycosyltransferase [bacterium]